MTKTLGPAPGFVNHPDHRIHISDSGQNWIARVGAIVLANSNRALVLGETGYETVIYFPREDVFLGRMQSTSDKTTCPFKGEARYFAQANDAKNQAVAWTYPESYDEVASITGHIAFYKNKVSLESTPVVGH